jgi:hypothetical protein
MTKRLLFVAVVLLIGAGLTIAAPAGKEGTWSGTVTDTACGAKDNHTAECTTKCVKEHGAKYAFVDSKTHKVYTLNPQDTAAPHAGHTVTVTGTVDGDTITATSITMPPAKGGTN